MEEALMEEIEQGTKKEFIEEADKETWEESKNKISKEASGEQPGKENAKNSLDYGISGIPLCIFSVSGAFQSDFILHSRLFGTGVFRLLSGNWPFYFLALLLYRLFTLRQYCSGRA